MVKIKGKKYYVWFIVDSETRFVLGFHLSPYRNSPQAFSLLNSVKDLGTPASVVTDRYSAYNVPVKSVLHCNHIKVQSFQDAIYNNLIECLRYDFIYDRIIVRFRKQQKVKMGEGLMEVVKVYKESMPQVRLVGKRYTNTDRDESGTFAKYWQQWFGEGQIETLKQQCKGIPNISDDSLGAMHMTGAGEDFEYWIGAFFAPDTDVPNGFHYTDIPAGEVGICWLSGKEETGELYSMEASDLSMKALSDKGWQFLENGWFFERYNNSRFTKPDEQGNIVLDIGAYLA